MTFGEKLQKLRKNKGMSQEQLAEQVSVSRQAISKWELGSAMPDTDKVIILSKLFDVSMDYLLDDEKTDILDNKEKPKVSTVRNSQSFSGVMEFVRKKGYIAGYIIAGYGVLGVAITRLAHYMFKKMLVPPAGFGLTLQDLPAQMKMPLYFANILSAFCLVVIIAGLVIAARLKKQST